MIFCYIFIYEIGMIFIDFEMFNQFEYFGLKPS